LALRAADCFRAWSGSHRQRAEDAKGSNRAARARWFWCVPEVGRQDAPDAKETFAAGPHGRLRACFTRGGTNEGVRTWPAVAVKIPGYGPGVRTAECYDHRHE